MPDLPFFCFSDNYPTALGGAVLSNALKTNTSIRELYWRGNELGNEGIKALCSALQERSTQMAVLDVGNNRSALVMHIVYGLHQTLRLHAAWPGWLRLGETAGLGTGRSHAAALRPAHKSSWAEHRQQHVGRGLSRMQQRVHLQSTR